MQEESYELTPKGWVYAIRMLIEESKKDEAIAACDQFSAWIDSHVVKQSEKKKSKRKKKK